MPKESDYYPSEIKLETFPNKIYYLSYSQNNTLRTKVLNKSKAFAMVNDSNVDRRIRDELVKAFRAGIIE